MEVFYIGTSIEYTNKIFEQLLDLVVCGLKPERHKCSNEAHLVRDLCREAAISYISQKEFTTESFMGKLRKQFTCWQRATIKRTISSERAHCVCYLTTSEASALSCIPACTTLPFPKLFRYSFPNCLSRKNFVCPGNPLKRFESLDHL